MKGKSPETIVLRFVWLESLTQDYTNAEIGQIIRDLYHYASQGTEPQQYADRGMRGLWRSMKDGVDKDFSKYREKSQKSSEAAKARWEKQTQKDDVLSQRFLRRIGCRSAKILFRLSVKASLTEFQQCPARLIGCRTS